MTNLLLLRFDTEHENQGRQLRTTIRELRDTGRNQEATEMEIRLRNRTLDRATPTELGPLYHFIAGACGGFAQSVFACPNEVSFVEIADHIDA